MLRRIGLAVLAALGLSLLVGVPAGAADCLAREEQTNQQTGQVTVVCVMWSGAPGGGDDGGGGGGGNGSGEAPKC